MRNILLTIAYDGTGYIGWQMQKKGISIEGEIKKGIEKLTGEEVKIYGSGRTDSKVHAFGQKANFFTNSDIPIERFTFGINHHIPEDIRILKAEEVDLDFHARYLAKGKTYEYVIYNDSIMNPLYINRAHHCFHKLDIDKMRQASKDLIGVHDFKGFMGNNSSINSTTREIYDIHLNKEGNFITLKITGSGFLYNMVRVIVGLLIDIGRGKFEVDRVREVLEKKDRELAKITAPPGGLYLKEVFYEKKKIFMEK